MPHVVFYCGMWWQASAVASTLAGSGQRTAGAARAVIQYDAPRVWSDWVEYIQLAAKRHFQGFQGKDEEEEGPWAGVLSPKYPYERRCLNLWEFGRCVPEFGAAVFFSNFRVARRSRISICSLLTSCRQTIREGTAPVRFGRHCVHSSRRTLIPRSRVRGSLPR